MFGVNMFFLILSVLLIYAVFDRRVNMLADKTLQVYEMKLDNILKEKENNEAETIHPNPKEMGE